MSRIGWEAFVCYKIVSCLDYNSVNIVLLAQYILCSTGTGTIAAAQYYVRLAGDSGVAIAYHLICLACCLMLQTIGGVCCNLDECLHFASNSYKIRHSVDSSQHEVHDRSGKTAGTV